MLLTTKKYRVDQVFFLKFNLIYFRSQSVTNLTCVLFLRGLSSEIFIPKETIIYAIYLIYQSTYSFTSTPNLNSQSLQTYHFRLLNSLR